MKLTEKVDPIKDGFVTEICKFNNGYDTVIFTNVPTFDVVVAEGQTHSIE